MTPVSVVALTHKGLCRPRGGDALPTSFLAHSKTAFWNAGTFQRGWVHCQSARSARDWAAGWDMAGDTCPADTLRDAQTPTGGWHHGDSWKKTFRALVSTQRAMRRAGYVSRHNWPRRRQKTRGHPWRHMATTPEGDASPVAGLPAVDPWELAARMARCCQTFHAQLRATPDRVRVVSAPYRCGLAHVCPVCAAAKSRKNAKALRKVIESGADGGGQLVLVTLTQRAKPGESLQSAQLRLRAGWRKMRDGGKVAKQWKTHVAGAWIGYEVTHKQGRGWHAHAHAVVSLQPGADLETAHDFIRRRWTTASGNAAADSDLWGYGHDAPASEPIAGDVWAPSGWFRPIKRENPRAVYQACKYPTPAASLSVAALAEFVANAHARRWHDGVGTLRGVHRMAAGLPDEPDELDLGVLVSMAGPGDSPTVGAVPDSGLVSWRTRFREFADVPVALRLSVCRNGGRWYVRRDRWVCEMPVDWAYDRLAESDDEIAGWIRAREADADASRLKRRKRKGGGCVSGEK